jgi:hypothetical protein
MIEKKLMCVARMAGAIGLVLTMTVYAADDAVGHASALSMTRAKAAHRQQVLEGARMTNAELRHFAVYTDFHALAAAPDHGVFLTIAGPWQSLPGLGGQRGLAYFACPLAHDGM